MTDRARGRARKVGLPPGTLIHIGEPGPGPVSLSILDYDAQRMEELRSAAAEDILPRMSKDTVTWVDVTGVHDVELVGRVGNLLGVHPLVLEDVVNTQQRPKVEVHDGYLFLVVKMVRFDPEADELDVEQVSLLLGRNYVVTFQERPGDVLEPVRERLRGARGRVRTCGADYLAYALLDLIVDHYFVALERLGADLEQIEEVLMDDPSAENLQVLHELRRVTVTLRRAAWPLRDVVLALERSGTDLVAPSTLPYLRDVYDHAVQVIETVETFREGVTGYLDVYLSSASNRMNEVMKMLTLIATVFIPLTFLVGVYGMNFDHMPELHWRWSYPLLWLVMLGVAGLMLWYFRKRRWL